MWRALRRGYEAEPRFLVVAFGLSLLSALPDALLALWLKLLADGVLSHSRGLVIASAVGLGLSATATWFLRVMSERTQRRFRERLTIALESHVAQLQASVATIEHHERPLYLNRLAVLRDQVFVLDHMYMSLFSTCGWILRLGVTVALLDVDPPGARAPGRLRAADGADVNVAAWRRACRPGTRRAGEPAGAVHVPDGHHRAARQGSARDRDRRPPGGRAPGGVGALVRSGGQVALGKCPLAHAGLGGLRRRLRGAVVFVARVLHATPGNVLLVLAAGSRLSAYLGATVGEIGFLRGIWLDGSRRLAWLEDYAASLLENSDVPVPERIVEGIRFENVSFTYPGTERQVLENVCLDLRPGSVVAIVGENGAGKTTLVKLLSRLYQPTSGRILVDGRDLGACPPRHGGRGSPARFKTSSASSSRRATPSESAIWAGSTTSRRWLRPSTARARMTSFRGCRPASKRNSGQPGPKAWR